jgi:hypothetical protein
MSHTVGQQTQDQTDSDARPANRGPAEGHLGVDGDPFQQVLVCHATITSQVKHPHRSPHA